MNRFAAVFTESFGENNEKWLYDKGITRLDTDTALDNHRAQRYYEKNGFVREGITRSYFLKFGHL